MWFKVDDRLMQSPEVLAIPRRHRAPAMGVWALCGAYCSQQLADRFVPNEVVKEAGGGPVIRGWLVAVGLWEEAEAGIAFTMQCCRIPQSDAIAKRRATTAHRVREYRRKQKEQKADQPVPDNVTPLRPTPVTHPVTHPNGISNTSSTEPKGSVLLPEPTPDTSVTSNRYVSNAHASNGQRPLDGMGRPSMSLTTLAGNVEHPPEPPPPDRCIPPEAAALVSRVAGGLPPKWRERLRVEVGEMWTDGIPQVDIERGFERLRDRLADGEDVHPGHLRQCVAQIVARNGRGHGKLSRSDEKALGWLAMKPREGITE